MSKREERIQKIVELLNHSDTVHVKDIARQLAVSEMTIRRDIGQTSSPLSLLGGHIVLATENKGDAKYFLTDQAMRNIEQKRHISTIAASLIEDSDTVFFDCGTTIPFIIEAIPDHIQFTGICYSINTFFALQQKENCKTILCGGEFNANNAVFMSINDQSPLDVICPSKAFISAAGVTPKNVTCFNLHEVYWKQKAMKQSGCNILTVDNSKFDLLKAAYIGQLSDFDALITNHIDDNYITLCNQLNVKIYQ